MTTPLMILDPADVLAAALAVGITVGLFWLAFRGGWSR